MNKPIEKAELLDVRVHEGSSTQPVKNRKSSRGRKAKKGRAVVKVRVTLIPTEVQKNLLESDLALFNYFYKDTVNRLSSAKSIRDKKGMWLSYSPGKKKVKWTVKKQDQGIVRQTPRFVMMAQTAIWNEYQWMQDCTYQVLHRATTNAFSEFLKSEGEKRFQIDGNKYEAKIKYGLRNGHLVMKKFEEFIRIKETGLPKGSLETALISNKGDEWTAELEILEPYDKVLDIKEEKSMLEVDTASHGIRVDEGKFSEKIFKEQSKKFRDIANRVIEDNIDDREEAQRHIKKAFPKEENKDLFNMACVAGVARVKGFSEKFAEAVPEEYSQDIYSPPVFEVPKIRKNYFAISEGFTIKERVLEIPALEIAVWLSGSRLSLCNLEYIVIYEAKKGEWKVAGKRRRRNVWRSFKERFRESGIQRLFAIKRDLPF